MMAREARTGWGWYTVCASPWQAHTVHAYVARSGYVLGTACGLKAVTLTNLTGRNGNPVRPYGGGYICPRCKAKAHKLGLPTTWEA